MTCPTEGLDSAPCRLAQMAAARARLNTHMRPVQGEPYRMKAIQTIDIVTVTAATPVHR
jgi:hypothetical protein